MNGEPDLLHRRSVAPRVRRRDPRDHQPRRRQRRRGGRRGHPDDARDAVAAARAAFDDGAWPATPVAERAALLDRIADLLQRDKESLAELETKDTGKTLAESRIDIDDVTSVFRYYARLVGRRVRPRRRRRRSRRHQPGGARAHRRVRADRAVELSAAADVLEDRARARRRLHDGRQAQRGDAAVDDRVRRTCSKRRVCRRRW